VARRLDIDLDLQSRLAEIRNLISSGATVIGTLGRSHDAHNCRVIDVEAPGNTSQTFPVDVASPDDLADLVWWGEFQLASELLHALNSARHRGSLGIHREAGSCVTFYR
jgi:hypothetical protein